MRRGVGLRVGIAADRWFRTTVGKAARLGLPVLGEVWLGGATEEMEPFINVPTPPRRSGP